MRSKILTAAFLAASPAFAQAAVAQNSAELKATYQDIQATLGRVPQYMKEISAATLPGLWRESKEVLLNPQGAIPPKYRGLIALAVSAQLSCKNCVFFDTESAKNRDAKPEELHEAIEMAGLTRHWSSFLNGSQIDPAAFKRETDEVMMHVRTVKAGLAEQGTPPSTEQQAGEAAPNASAGGGSEVDRTYQDIQKTLGRVPLFLRDFPKEGIVGAWKEMKELQLSPNTAIPPKYKELIGLAVAAQIPCSYCSHFHTEAAKVNGATPDEIKETLAIASLARQREAIFSTMTESDSAFRRDVLSSLRFVREHRMKQQLGGQMPQAAPSAGASE